MIFITSLERDWMMARKKGSRSVPFCTTNAFGGARRIQTYKHKKHTHTQMRLCNTHSTLSLSPFIFVYHFVLSLTDFHFVHFSLFLLPFSMISMILFFMPHFLGNKTILFGVLKIMYIYIYIYIYLCIAWSES
jgi:hypothetical protein